MKYCLILTLSLALFSSCSKQYETERVLVDCDNVEVSLKSSLDKDIIDLVVNDVEYGLLAPGETATVCLTSMSVDMFSDNPMLALKGFYESEEIGACVGWCGVGLMTVYDGEFSVEINDVSDGYFYYR